MFSDDFSIPSVFSFLLVTKANARGGEKEVERAGAKPHCWLTLQMSSCSFTVFFMFEPENEEPR